MCENKISSFRNGACSDVFLACKISKIVKKARKCHIYFGLNEDMNYPLYTSNELVAPRIYKYQIKI